jgi:hypothetical protein
MRPYDTPEFRRTIHLVPDKAAEARMMRGFLSALPIVIPFWSYVIWRLCQ